MIATTRPETLPGDTAVAVNPEDPRYGDLVGKTLRLPTTDRIIPIIADSYVDTKFGTGAVKLLHPMILTTMRWVSATTCRASLLSAWTAL